MGTACDVDEKNVVLEPEDTITEEGKKVSEPVKTESKPAKEKVTEKKSPKEKPAEVKTESTDSSEKPASETVTSAKPEKENDENLIEITFNGEPMKVPTGLSIFEATLNKLSAKDSIPTLCHHPCLPSARLYKGKCGICEVEDQKTGKLIRSCKIHVEKGMKISSNSQKVVDNIKEVLKRKLSKHPMDCLNCDENGDCLFQRLLQRFKISPKDLVGTNKETYMKNYQNSMMNKKNLIENNSLTFDMSKCIKCHRCVRVCQHIQGMSVQSLNSDSKYDKNAVHLFKDIEDYHRNMYASDCISCGQCSFVCPVGAISEKSAVSEVSELLSMGREIVKVCQIAPSVRVTLSEAFGLKPGEFLTEQIVSSLKQLGFDYVFDTQFAADLTVMEEGEEIVQRILNNGPWPMFSSCCPGWVNLVEKHYPEFIPNLSTCKSPHQMMGTLIKEYWATEKKIKKENIKVVSIMPCTAKKDDIQRKQFKGTIDYVLTTRELSRLLKMFNIKVKNAESSKFDSLLSESSGASTLFGVTGGVTEAALRTVYEKLVGTPLPKLEFDQTRGLDPTKNAVIKLKKGSIRVTVCHSTKNIREVLKEITKLKNEKDVKVFDQPWFIEMMACRGGCIGGGGNPKRKSESIGSAEKFLLDRIKCVYNTDEKMAIRKSHENPSIKQLYEKFLGEPLKGKSHDYLHTTYEDLSDTELMGKIKGFIM